MKYKHLVRILKLKRRVVQIVLFLAQITAAAALLLKRILYDEAIPCS